MRCIFTVTVQKIKAFLYVRHKLAIWRMSTLALQNLILPRIADKRDTAFDDCLEFWSNATSAAPLAEPASHKQRACDRFVVYCVKESLHSNCVSPIDRARMLGSCAPHSGDWLNAMPVSSCGLFLSDEVCRWFSHMHASAEE